MKFIDSLLNRITMYRLVVYGLGIISFISFIFSITGRFAMMPKSLAVSFVILFVATFVTEWVLAKSWRTPFNNESWLITALIIFLIFPPPKNFIEAVTTGLVAIIASASKYLIAWRGKHIFNPAAIAVAIVGFLGFGITTWWVGNSALWPFTLILGLLVVRKIKRFPLVLTFVGVALAFQVILFAINGSPIAASMQSVLIASPLIFLSTIMLTEPATMPPRRNQQIIFGALVAILYVGAWKIGPIYIYPEVALLIGNIYAFIVSPKFKVKLYLKEMQKISEQVYNFVFIPEKKFDYKAGQYMEWTLPHVALDGRGNRRAFTLASSPTEDTVQLGVKFYNPSSTFKYELSQMKKGDSIYGSQLSGSFTLDQKYHKKLVFIAGGIGVTPFRSMVKYITDMGLSTDIYVLYIVSKPEELAYIREFQTAQNNGVRFVPILSDMTRTVPGIINGDVDQALIEKIVPDYQERLFYISGPNAMVQTTKKTLRHMNVQRTHIKTDYFSGY